THYQGVVGLNTHSYTLSNVTLPQTHATLLIGPEGGFSSEEISSLLNRFTPVTFGPYVQRAETAAITGSTLLRALR
ncbi:MAG: RsmE family RNA methyltransferase, partial [Candidatus Paceibacteria bacterium]